MTKRSLPLSQVYRLLEPGPVVLVITAGGERPDVMPMSWHTMMEFEPPLVGCVISGRNRTFDLLQAAGECVLNIPSVALARPVVACGSVSGRRVDKFEAFGLTSEAARRVGAPLIAECHASLECRVADRRLVEAYNFFILEVVQAWVRRSGRRPRTIHHQGRGTFMVAGDLIELPSRKR